MVTDIVGLLCELVAIPSVNPMGRELTGPEFYETRLTEYLVRFFERLGVPHEVQEVLPGRGNVIARFDPPGADPNGFVLLLDAHQDTVPVDGMTIPPFEPQVRDGRVYGRGSCDVKAGMAAMLWAFQRLVKEAPAGGVSVIMSCSCDEESTAQGIKALARLWGDKLGQSKLVTRRPDAAIVAEPTLLDVVVAHRGASRFCIRTRGRACHSSDPSQGVNAIYRMAKLVSALEQYAAELPERVAAHPLCGGATLSVGLISGGSSVNIVPDECVIQIDRRVVPGEDSNAVVSDIHEYLTRKTGSDFEFEPPWLDGATLNDDNNQWIADGLLKVVSKVAGPRQAVGVPYGTNASRTSHAGVPSVVFGPGSIAQAHTKDEWVDIEQLKLASEVLFQYCCRNPSECQM